MCALFKPRLEIFWWGLFEKWFFSTFGSYKYWIWHKNLKKVFEYIGGAVLWIVTFFTVLATFLMISFSEWYETPFIEQFGNSLSFNQYFVNDFCSIYKNCLRFWKSWIMRCMWPKVFNIYFILGRVWGRVRGCQPRHKWVWGGCVTLSWKMLNQKALTKRFSFVVHMNTWTNTY